MQIDWFTVIAQIINFFILVWLLKRYLYQPILGAIDAREKKINGQIQDAEGKREDAQREKALYIEKNKLFDEQKQQHLNDLLDEIKAERKKRLDAVAGEAEMLRAEHKHALLTKQNDMLKEIAQKTQREVLQISRKTLKDLATVSLDEQMIAVFLKKLRTVQPEEKLQLIQAYQSAANPVRVQTAFNLDSDLQNEIKSEVDKILGASAEYLFRVSSQLTNGIELSLNGYKFSWTVSAYLDELQQEVSETIKQTSDAVAQQK
ncbi:F0F1 ATP synthase subunit B family protein [Arundinibacter roseus]|uniref:ATP synthase subunit b n=1 Tax=Arundinibacter roseus TaxID=2070510 RepID=A0A4R4KIK9_9BACT|nr:F0F1 ATP synthase subunit B [Arundinibacter roseus]TDB68037.1 F0F1 ATP synthase subunit B [Arundinibacter roseus]